MKLSFDTIRSISVGAIRVWEENGNIRFSKGTQKQIDAWYAFEPVLGERAETTTGIRLDLHTNSSKFAFTAAMGNRFEIYVNDVMMYNIMLDKDNRSFSIDIDKSISEENRVTLILPSHEICVLKSVEVDDGATVKPHSFDCKLLMIGDSITQGWESGYDSLSYAYRVSRAFNAHSVIYGIGGGFFHESVLDDELDFEPDAITVAFGTNDWGRRKTLEALKKNTKEFFDKLRARYPHTLIFGISPLWRADKDQVKPSGSFKEITDAVKEEILAHGAILVDGELMTPHLPEFFSDGFLHPNALGFGIYAENLVRVMNPYLKK